MAMMADDLLKLILLLLLQPSVQGNIDQGREPRYLVSVPNLIRVAEPFHAHIFVYNTNEANVTLTLKGKGSRTLASSWVVVDQEIVEKVPFVFNSYSSLRPDRYGRRYVTLVVEAPPNVYTTHNQRVKILVSPKYGHLFIQTNKPVYTPHDKGKHVHVRVYSVDNNMKPQNRTIQIDLIDPSGTVVGRRSATPYASESGIYFASFPFPEYPAVGAWAIVAKSGHNKELTERTTFLVKPMALEPFHVQVTAEKYIYSSQEYFKVVVTPSYPNGRRVIGRIQAEFFTVINTDDETAVGSRQTVLTGSNSSATFDLSLRELHVSGNEFNVHVLAGARFRAVVYVLDKASGQEVKVTEDVAQFVRSPFAISYERSAKFFRKAKFYDLQVSVRYLNGTAASHLPITITHGLNVTTDRTNSYGHVVRRFNTIRKDEKLSFMVETKAVGLAPAAQMSSNLDVFAAHSPGGATLKLSPESRQLKVKDTVRVHVTFTNTLEAYDILNILVISRGQIIRVLSETLRNSAMRAIEFTATRAMVPMARVVGFFVLKDGQVVTDSLAVRIHGRCQEVACTLKDKSVLPNQGNKVQVKGPQGSYLAFLWADMRLQSAGQVLALQDQLTASMAATDTGCGPGGDGTADDIFQNAGLVAATNLAMKTATRTWFDCRKAAPPPRKASHRWRRGVGANGADKEYVNFDLWGAWETKVLGSEEFTFEVPSTAALSTRYVQVVSMSPKDGMCVLPQLRYKVQDVTQLELQLSLPYELEVGQQAELTATVTNKQGTRLLVKAYLKGTRAICSGIESATWSEPKEATVDRGQGVTFTWPVVPLSQGKVDLEVKAEHTFSSIVVKKQLNVVVGGVVHNQERTFLLEPGSSNLVVAKMVGRSESAPIKGVTVIQNVRNRELHTIAYQISTPQGSMIRNSLYYEISIMGEPLLPAVSAVLSDGLVQLLSRKPIGCGEQSMMRIGPIVFALQYLEKTKQTNGTVEDETYTNIENGIQYMQRFRNSDGSFSVWPGQPPSVWLTAYITTMLSKTYDYSDTIRGNYTWYVCESALWLTRQQRPDGAFNMDEIGVLVDQRVAGGVDGVRTMTAYVLIAFTEANCKGTESAARRAQEFTQMQSRALHDVYPLAITAYALSLRPDVDVTVKRELLDKLMNKSELDTVSEERWWVVDMSTFSRAKRISMLYRPALAVEIETAAYALLTLMKLGRMKEAGQVAGWLIARHKYNGHFVSTQDTVIGLQALTLYRTLTYSGDLDMTVKIASETRTFASAFKLDASKKDIRTAFVITNEVKANETFIVEASGSGIVRMTVRGFYKKPHTDEDCPFGLSVKALHFHSGGNDTCGNNMTVSDTCIKIAFGRIDFNGTRTMAIVKVGLTTGMTLDRASLDQLVDNNELVSHYEVTGRGVVLYLVRIPASRQAYANFLVRQHARAESNPVEVTAYDYYAPEQFTCRTFYIPDTALDYRSPKIRVYTMPDGTLRCTETSPPKCYGLEPGRDRPWGTEKLNEELCVSNNMFDYAYIVKFVRKRRVVGKLDEEEIEANVLRVLKAENSDLVVSSGSTVYFYVSSDWNSRCAPRLAPSTGRAAEYLVTGYARANHQQDAATPRYHMTSSTYLQRIFTRRELRVYEARLPGDVNDRPFARRFIYRFACVT